MSGTRHNDSSRRRLGNRTFARIHPKGIPNIAAMSMLPNPITMVLTITCAYAGLRIS